MFAKGARSFGYAALMNIIIVAMFMIKDFANVPEVCVGYRFEAQTAKADSIYRGGAASSPQEVGQLVDQVIALQKGKSISDEVVVDVCKHAGLDVASYQDDFLSKKFIEDAKVEGGGDEDLTQLDTKLRQVIKLLETDRLVAVLEFSNKLNGFRSDHGDDVLRKLVKDIEDGDLRLVNWNIPKLKDYALSQYRELEFPALANTVAPLEEKLAELEVKKQS
eukprot:TRINITY_DN31472_c0_g1_i1.p1 TRINITY_DN31472_c0_g1~~TRINITY_DN31472_c0_g1_i1.p1  ORF type:complete len:220 (-),score=41.22 TRINITY_DN31472_c0_g1_i1:231-890(-)